MEDSDQAGGRARMYGSRCYLPHASANTAVAVPVDDCGTPRSTAAGWVGRPAGGKRAWHARHAAADDVGWWGTGSGGRLHLVTSGPTGVCDGRLVDGRAWVGLRSSARPHPSRSAKGARRGGAPGPGQPHRSSPPHGARRGRARRPRAPRKTAAEPFVHLEDLSRVPAAERSRCRTQIIGRGPFGRDLPREKETPL